ncbi:DUF456 domain-containing protein [Fundidesulfovibrio butyratiphilus]
MTFFVYLWAVLFLALLVSVLGLHIFSLPANWVVLGLVLLWGWTHPELALGWGFYLTLFGIALVAEVVEFLFGFLGGAKYGASVKGNLGAFIGAIAGAILGAPFFFGVGALAGALTGAYLGCFVLERIHGRPAHEAWQAAKGAMIGRMFGLVTKIGLGALMLTLTARAIWP